MGSVGVIWAYLCLVGPSCHVASLEYSGPVGGACTPFTLICRSLTNNGLRFLQLKGEQLNISYILNI
ncbi:hypothetical protein PR002_g17713 [Phytophthora rubi]|uniref:Secreted protein n=1 Tax=Phytophthora rubi TaxID=129364 RepID=A0A6A3K3B3_9STRA|nr:hypothetical protein PR002_g17713 [Phytophthora rubi]